MVGQRVEEGVCSGIVTLCRIAKDTRNGGEEDEAIEPQILRVLMQQPGAVSFWSHDRAQTLSRESGQRCIVNDHGEVEDSLQRNGLRACLFDHAFHIGG